MPNKQYHRNIQHYNSPNFQHYITPQPPPNSDLPPLPPTDSFPKEPPPPPAKIPNIDNDTLILLGLMYLIYKNGNYKDNLKLLLALGYILL